MSDTDSFGENPFRALNSKSFPDKDKARSASADYGARRSRHASRRRAARVPLDAAGHEDDPALADENDLFLQAMSRVRTVPSGQCGRKDAGGFTLEEHCSLPTARERRKARKKPAEPAATCSLERGPQGAASVGANPLFAAGSPDVSEEDADAAAFLQAMAQVSPLQARGRDVAPEPEPGTPPPQGELSLQDFMEGRLEFALSLTDEYLEGHVVGLDQMIMNKLRAGSLSPEAHLDLHGLNAMQAFEALRGFMRACWYKGLRTVLVVPGRGRNSPDGMGVLREKLQNWLTQDPFKRVVLAFCTAQPHDGGPGSVYVLLRKYRKKGRIYWERTPADADLY